MITRLHLQASAPGLFQGQNQQFNGAGYFEQHFLARALTPAGFEAWVRHARARGIALSPTAYRLIEQRTTLMDTRKALGVGPGVRGAVYFSAVPRGLFARIVRSFHTNSMANPAAP
jgi:cytochrome o ubiquinol oxidase subunit 2